MSEGDPPILNPYNPADPYGHRATRRKTLTASDTCTLSELEEAFSRTQLTHLKPGDVPLDRKAVVSACHDTTATKNFKELSIAALLRNSLLQDWQKDHRSGNIFQSIKYWNEMNEDGKAEFVDTHVSDPAKASRVNFAASKGTEWEYRCGQYSADYELSPLALTVVGTGIIPANLDEIGKPVLEGSVSDNQVDPTLSTEAVNILPIDLQDFSRQRWTELSKAYRRGLPDSGREAIVNIDRSKTKAFLSNLFRQAAAASSALSTAQSANTKAPTGSRVASPVSGINAIDLSTGQPIPTNNSGYGTMDNPAVTDVSGNGSPGNEIDTTDRSFLSRITAACLSYCATEEAED